MKTGIYDRILAGGQEMTPEEVRESIRTLAADPRFAALLTWLERNYRSFTEAGTAQALAQHHGVLAHCAGSAHAVLVLQGQLRQILEPKPRESRRQPNEG